MGLKPQKEITQELLSQPDSVHQQEWRSMVYKEED